MGRGLDRAEPLSLSGFFSEFAGEDPLSNLNHLRAVFHQQPLQQRAMALRLVCAVAPD